jgi:hypothetical protein
MPPEMLAALAQQGQIQFMNMIQAHGPDEVPFLCLPGVRQYHDNPAHTGDSWLLHRRSGEGSLHFLVEQIWKYGVNPVELQMNLNFVMAAPHTQYPCEPRAGSPGLRPAAMC